MTIVDFVDLLPGFTAVISGILAIVVTFHTPTTKRAKKIWLFVFVLLGSIAVLGSIWQQKTKMKRESERDNEFAYMKDKLTSLVKYTTQPAPANQEIRKIAQSLEKLEESIRYSVGASQQETVMLLKKRAQSLSIEILKFLEDRGAPPLPRGPETWQQDTDSLISFYSQTMSIFSRRFGARVIATRDEFAERSIIDSELDRFYKHPTNPIGIRIVGERIGALAEKLR